MTRCEQATGSCAADSGCWDHCDFENMREIFCSRSSRICEATHSRWGELNNIDDDKWQKNFSKLEKCIFASSVGSVGEMQESQFTLLEENIRIFFLRHSIALEKPEMKHLWNFTSVFNHFNESQPGEMNYCRRLETGDKSLWDRQDDAHADAAKLALISITRLEWNGKNLNEIFVCSRVFVVASCSIFDTLLFLSFPSLLLFCLILFLFADSVLIFFFVWVVELVYSKSLEHKQKLFESLRRNRFQLSHVLQINLGFGCRSTFVVFCVSE